MPRSPAPSGDATLKTITGRSAAWTALDGIPPALLAGVEDHLGAAAPGPAAEIIKDNNVRSALVLETGAQDCPRVFVKFFKKPHGFQALRYLLTPSKALEEWRNLLWLAQRGLPCARPLAFFEKRSFRLLRSACLVTHYIPGAQPLNEFYERCGMAAGQRFQLARQLARLSAAMHAAGLFSRDYHAGNIMIRAAQQGFELFLIDLHRARVVKKVKPAMIFSDLAQLANSLPASRSARLRFLREYYRHAPVPGIPLGVCVRRISDRAGRLAARRIISRSKRCLMKSSVFEVARTWSERYCGRRDFGRDAARTLVGRHLAGGAHADAVIKRSSKSMLTTHVLAPGGILCVKGYARRGVLHALAGLLRKSRAMKSWIAANGLIVRGLLTPQPLAVIEKRFGPFVRENFYICRWLDSARELNAYITSRQWPRADREKFIRALAETLAGLHAKGVYHADLKSNNILVRENRRAWDFLFIDLDRVSFSRPLTFERRANNLAQINASVAAVMTPRDRLLFFRIYSRSAACYTERKRYFKRILAISRTKITHPYGLHFTH